MKSEVGTDHNTGEDTQRISTPMLRFAMDNATIAMFTVDEDGRFVEINDTACRFLGYTREELLGMSVPDISADVSREAWPQHWAMIKQSGKTVFHQKHVAKSGHQSPVEVATSYFEYDGRAFVLACVSDLTERNRAEASLRASERYNRALFDQSPVGQSLISPDGTLVDVNHAYAQVLGRPVQQIVGQTFWSFTPVEYHELGRRSLDHARAQGSFPPHEKEYIRPDGTRVPVRITGMLLNRDGQSLVWSCVQDISEELRARRLEKESQAELERRVKERTRELIRANNLLAKEVTDRRRTERVLEETKARLLSVLSSNPMLVYSYRIDTDSFLTTFVSENSEEQSGYPARMFMDDPGFWIDHVHPDDRDLALRQLTGLVQAGSGSFEYRFLHGDGSYHWVRDTARVVYDEHDRPIELVGCWNDVTDQRQAEQQLRLIRSAVTDISEAVMITDARFEDGGPYIEYVNPAFETITGYASEEVVGRPSRLMRGYGSDHEALEQLKTAIREGRTYRGRVVNYRRNREDYTVNWRASPIRDHTGTITHWVVVQEDITQQLQDQDMLRKREAELEHIARLSTMGEMASGLAHELNQPLTAIQNYASGALRRIDHEDESLADIIQALEHIGIQAERSGQVIHRLRRFVDKREPTRSTIVVGELIRDVLMLFGPELRTTATQVDLNLAEGLPILYADHVQIEQVLLNLLRNAAASMAGCAPDQRVIEVRARCEASGQIILEICDRGCGLNDQQLNQIFNPFYTTKPDGLGMGLTISQSIVQMHGGRLQAERRACGGMCFKITLPGKG